MAAAKTKQPTPTKEPKCVTLYVIRPYGGDVIISSDPPVYTPSSGWRYGSNYTELCAAGFAKAFGVTISSLGKAECLRIKVPCASMTAEKVTFKMVEATVAVGVDLKPKAAKK